MDPGSSRSFDVNYFIILAKNMGLFQSDAALLTDRTSAKIAKGLQSSADFFSEFSKSMKKMAAIKVLTESAGEIRKNCRVVN
ncbi:Peroxidase [Bertholletia excelsa]